MTKTQNKNCIVFEKLSLFAGIFYFLPLFLRINKEDIEGMRVFYIDSTSLGLAFGRWCASWRGIKVLSLQFRLTDIKDKEGNLLRLRIAYQDLAEVRDMVLQQPVFQHILDVPDVKKSRLGEFLEKQITAFTWRDTSSLWRIIFLIHIARWKADQECEGSCPVVLFAYKRNWMPELKRYAAQSGVDIQPVWKMIFHPKKFVMEMFGEVHVQALYYRFIGSGFKGLWGTVRNPGPDAEVLNGGASKAKEPKLMVEYQGQFNLDRPELFSDLFFLSQSQLSGKDVQLLFYTPRDPLDEEKVRILEKYGIEGVSRNPKAVKSKAASVFYYVHGESRRGQLSFSLKKFGPRAARRWAERQIQNYQDHYGYWRQLFRQFGVKVFVSWWKFDPYHCVLADALEALGGVTAIYQRSFEEFASPESTTAADVVFGFSPMGARVDQEARSKIPYYVTVGYLGDCRFALVKDRAKEVREALQAKGARRIMAFFDESSGNDSRWHTGHEFMRANYDFLLNKILENPWLGLVLKPKSPRSLIRRLGPLLGLYHQAIATGRCYVFQEGVLQGAYPPCAAAQAADIAVHGHLCAASAGMDAALAGIPTLLLDREGWPRSMFYRLGVGKVVFQDWESLWSACQEHWSSHEGIPGLGDWSLLLDELDPFHDGRAAERMGTYLNWLMEGFKSGMPRETILADSAERYARQWGKDKIRPINC